MRCTRNSAKKSLTSSSSANRVSLFSLWIHFLISLLLALIISKLKADENARHNRIKGMEVGIEVENIPLISS